MKTLKMMTATTAAAALLVGAVAAQAQQPPAPGAQRPGMEGPRAHRGQHHDPAEMRAMATERLTAALQLTPAQKPALDAFVAAMAPPEGAREAMRQRRGEMADMTTPQRLDAMAARMNERQQAFAQRAAATKRFYAQLTPAQQKAFDAIRPMGGHRGMGHGMGHGGMGGHHKGGR